MERLASVRGALSGGQREGAAKSTGHHAQGTGWQLAGMAQVCHIPTDETPGKHVFQPLPILDPFAAGNSIPHFRVVILWYLCMMSVYDVAHQACSI